MTDGDDILDGDSRRSFMKKGALATGALALGATGSVAAQQGGGGDGGGGGVVDDGGGEAIVQVSAFYPRARFSFVSGVIDWTPDVREASDDIFQSFNTYMIRWLNTSEITSLWVAQDAEIGEFDENLGFVPDADDDPNQPQLYEMDREWELLEESDRFVEVTFSPVPEEEEDTILENDDWWQDQPDGNGTTTPGS